MMKCSPYWEVTYKNGDTVGEHELPYPQLDRTQVRKFSIRTDRSVLYSINIEENDSFLYRRRVCTDGINETVCFIVARYTPVGKKIAFIFKDTGKIVIKDKFVNNHKWFYAPSNLGFE